MNKNHKLQNFFNNVTIKLNIHDWKLNLKENSSEGYCWKNKKIIDAGLNYNPIKELIIHEISHIQTCRFCNNSHNPTYWTHFLNNMKKFLPKDKISEHAHNHIEFSQEGFYRRCYEK